MYSTAPKHSAMVFSVLNKHATICSNPPQKVDRQLHRAIRHFCVNELKNTGYNLTDLGIQGKRLLNAYFAFMKSCTDDVSEVESMTDVLEAAAEASEAAAVAEAEAAEKAAFRSGGGDGGDRDGVGGTGGR